MRFVDNGAFDSRKIFDGRMMFGGRKMFDNKKAVLNLVLGGGGIKGVAYAGVFEVAYKRGYKFGNITGVSAGAVAGSYAAAGYKTEELLKILEQFDFSDIDISKIPEKVPAIQRIMELKYKLKKYDNRHDNRVLRYFLTQKDDINIESEDHKVRFLKNIVVYSKEGSLFDGGIIEEWASKTLKKGDKNFW